MNASAGKKKKKAKPSVVLEIKERPPPSTPGVDPFGADAYRGGTPKGTKPATAMLRDMRHVYENPKKSDETEGHKKCRESYERSPDKFLERLNRLEVQQSHRNEKSKDKAAAKAAAEGEEAISPSMLDDGEKRVRELIAMLLLEAGEK
jgi:hypothetical protein